MKIICYGDSNTWGFDPRSPFGDRYDSPWPEILARKRHCEVVNQGENGRQIPTHAVSFSLNTDLMIIMLGTNDLLQFGSPEAVCNKMELFLSALKLHRSKILLIAPPPMKLGECVLNQELIDSSVSLARGYQALAQRLCVRFADAGKWNVPLAFDGVHLTEEGHISFAEGLHSYLEKENE